MIISISEPIKEISNKRPFKTNNIKSASGIL